MILEGIYLQINCTFIRGQPTNHMLIFMFYKNKSAIIYHWNHSKENILVCSKKRKKIELWQLNLDIYRRIVDLHEREYLKSQNVVTESQCDLGLTALKLDEVLELMSVDYPDKCHVNSISLNDFSFIFLSSSNSMMFGNKNVAH